ncbi:MAG: hypothetical protein J6Y08_07035 [Clostridiales bacterium]|nr:hypothetical protein [Clostridiales bacterium]
MNDTNQEKRYYAPASRSGEKRVFFIAIILIAAVILGVFGWKEYQLTQPQKISALMSMKTMVNSGDYYFAFAYFDGTEGKFWSDSRGGKGLPIIRSMVDSISKAKGKIEFKNAEEMMNDITYPIYSIFVTGHGGDPILAIYTNGYLILDNHKVYQCEIDFSEFVLASDTYFDASSFDTIKGHSMFRTLATYIGWNKEYLKKSTLLEPEIDGIEVELGISESYISDRSRMRIDMTSQRDDNARYYDTAFVQIQLDGEWYDVPLDMCYRGVRAGGGIYQSLPKGETVSALYDISQYRIGYDSCEKRLVIPVLTDETSGYVFYEFF